MEREFESRNKLFNNSNICSTSSWALTILSTINDVNNITAKLNTEFSSKVDTLNSTLVAELSSKVDTLNNYLLQLQKLVGINISGE